MKVCVVGAGHIGLPTAAIIADKGISVVAADVNEHIVEMINRGEAHVHETGVEPLLKKVVKSGKLKASTDVIGSVRESNVVIVVVPTPLGLDGPNMEAIKTAGKTVGKAIKRGALVILESTVYPGTTEEFFKPLLEKNSRMVCGEDFYLAYSPERAMPTRSLYELRHNPRIIGGINKASTQKAKAFYSRIIEGKVVSVESATLAEFIKLSENIYRDVNIALANELAIVADSLGIDIQKVIQVANEHPRVRLHSPGAGVGGHCIPKDPYFMINKGRELGLKTDLICTARKINEKMPEHVVGLVESAFEALGKSIEKSKIAVLGYAYKGDTSDCRGTPASQIVRELKSLGGDVRIHDPFVNADGIKIERNLGETLRGSDCAVVVTDHSEYRKLNIRELTKQMRLPAALVDGRNIFDPKSVEDAGLRYYGIGR